MEGTVNSKGKGLAHPVPVQPPRRPPDNSFAMAPPRRRETSFAPEPEQTLRWGLIPMDITQGSTTITTNAVIDSRSPDSYIGTPTAQLVKILPVVKPKKIKTIKGTIRCSRALLYLRITSHASPPRHGGDLVDRFSHVQVLPEEYGDVPLTIGSDLLYNLLQEQPEFNRFCHMELKRFGALRFIRKPRHALSGRQGRHRHGLRGSSRLEYVASMPAAPSATYQALERQPTVSGSPLTDQPHNSATPLPPSHQRHSPVLLRTRTPVGIPTGVVPIPPIDPAFFTSPVDAPHGFWRSAVCNPQHNFSGNNSGTSPPVNQDMAIQEDYELVDENPARPSDPGPSSARGFDPFN